MRNIDVVIIEDDIDTQYVLTKYFQANGVSCKCARDVSSGLTLLKDDLPSILLVDILLPDKKGDSLIKDVKLNPTYNNTLIYVLSAMPYGEAIKLVERYNIDGVIRKPFHLKDIDNLIKKLRS